MLIIHGKQTGRIKKYTDNQQACKNCGAFDLDVRVYRDFFHLLFIPVFPIGKKTAEVRCNNCRKNIKLGPIQNHYENLTKTPIYLYTLPIIFISLVAFLVVANHNTQKEKQVYIDNPKIGDVYHIRKQENDSTTYYFLRIANIKGDTVIAYHNNFKYYRFAIQLNEEDFFVKDEALYFTKNELKQMLYKKEINSVERNYSDYEGFNRIR